VEQAASCVCSFAGVSDSLQFTIQSKSKVSPIMVVHPSQIEPCHSQCSANQPGPAANATKAAAKDFKLVTTPQHTMKKTYFHIENSLNLDRVCWCHLRITHGEIDVDHRRSPSFPFL